MNIIRSTVIIGLFLLVASTRCFALWEIELSNAERAKELGIEVTSKTMNQNEVGVWLELKPKGKLEKFSHVGLEISSDGKKLVSTNLLPSRQTDESVVVSFYADPAFIPTSKMTVYVWSPSGRGGVGYQFNVKEIAKPEKVR